MGYYINPSNMPKEQWLEENGQNVSPKFAREHKIDGRYLVCLVDNGPFTAAGICYDDRERDAFLIPDQRPKTWYLVSKELLQPFCSRL